jgi:hypothetical protein
MLPSVYAGHVELVSFYSATLIVMPLGSQPSSGVFSSVSVSSDVSCKRAGVLLTPTGVIKIPARNSATTSIGRTRFKSPPHLSTWPQQYKSTQCYSCNSTAMQYPFCRGIRCLQSDGICFAHHLLRICQRKQNKEVGRGACRFFRRTMAAPQLLQKAPSYPSLHRLRGSQ